MPKHRQLIYDCPSPTGKNANKLYLLQGRIDEPLGAYDAALAQKHQSQNVEQLFQWITSNLQGTEIAELVERLQRHAELTPAAAGANYAQDDRLGHPAVRKAMAHITIDTFGVPAPRRETPTAAAARDFYERYPAAARIGLG